MISNSRLLTSKQLQLEGEFYQAFMEGGATVASFCSTEVEPMYKESDHIHIIGKRIHPLKNASFIYVSQDLLLLLA